MGVNRVSFNTEAGEEVLIDLTRTTAQENTVFDGETFHGADGEEKIGKFTIEQELTDQDALIAQIEAALEGKASGGGGGGEFPEGYRRCDYIQFTGEQTVDTGIVCNQDTTIKVVFTREKSAAHYLCGVASSDNTASVTAYFNGNWRFGNKASAKNPTASEDMIYSGILSNSQITITASKTAISGVNEFETVGSMLLGACRSASGAVAGSQFEGKILLWLMWSGSELVQKLIPVVDSDGVYRFYDAVSKEFFDSITDTPLDGGNL